MRRVNTSHLCIIFILASFISTPSHAFGFSTSNSKASVKDKNITTNRPWGNLGTPKSAPKYQPLPPPASYYMANTPGSGWYQQQLPVNSTAPAAQPRVEVDLEGSVFYEQQNMIYTVHVVSDVNVKTLKPELPRIEGAAMEQLDGPILSTRRSGRNNKRQIINTYRYKLMPLRSGEITIPAVRFTGTQAQSRQQPGRPGIPATASTSSFSIAAESDRTLRVLKANSEVNPWLPLHDLKLETSLLQKGAAKAGEPVTLIVELSATGALGNQLPSLAQQLESEHYRIYRDATEVKNAVSANGRYLTGTRKETYTVIPLEDGRIRLPDVGVAWWDVDTHSARLAGLPHTGKMAATGRGAASASGEQSMFPVYFWAPLIITMALLAGFWLGAWHRTRPLLKSAAAWSLALGQNAVKRAHRVGIKLSPASHLKHVRMGLALLMPRSVKLWMCTRCLHAESDPDAWCAEFKSRVCQHLNISQHSSLTHITEEIIAVSPQAEPTRLRDLAHSLDGAIYGGNVLDFQAWKRELTHQLRPGLLRRGQSQTRRTKSSLPALNPRAA